MYALETVGQIGLGLRTVGYILGIGWVIGLVRSSVKAILRGCIIIIAQSVFSSRVFLQTDYVCSRWWKVAANLTSELASFPCDHLR